MKKILFMGIIALLVGLMGCSSQDLADQNTALSAQVEALEEQLEHEEEESGLYHQIIEGFDDRPVTPNLPNHVYKFADNDGFVFLHFDKPIAQATKLLYTGRTVPGKFCKEDQDALPRGFTHFHKKFVAGDDPEAGHGGAGGEEGYWFIHVAATDLDMPWGKVSPGVDYKFMPTPPPSCAELDIAGY